MIDKAIFGYSFLRSGFFFLESLPILLIQKSLMTGEAEQMPRLTKQQLQVVDDRVKSLLEADAQCFADKIYPYQLLLPESPVKHFTRFTRILADSFQVALRRKSKKHRDIPKAKSATRSELPDYFLRNFHFQTDGYLSEKSADFYTHQVEILFKGTAAAMRRLVLRGMHGQVASGSAILDVGCGEGVSTRIVAQKYPNSRIVGVDLSPQYIRTAQDQSMPNTEYNQCAGENLLFRDASFDKIMSTYLFHELPHTIRVEVLEEMYRCLKPGGTVHLLDSLQRDDDPEMNWALEQFPIDFHEPFYKNYIENPLRIDIENAGFHVTRQDIGFLSKCLVGHKPQ